ncbi:MAG: PDDEXK nuclease domain-containing protein [Thermoplasmata archaeon]|nr:PDDEXK nuclease domain-containing protein [Thermoplasmata archaeon]
MTDENLTKQEYIHFLEELKARIRTARAKAVLSVSRELISLYWDIGKRIVEKQKETGWGKGVVEQLSADIGHEFPDVKGFSASNIWRMRAFYLVYSGGNEKLARAARENEKSEEIAQVVRELEYGIMPEILASIPWGHNLVLVEKVKDADKRLWYVHQTAINGWSRNVLVHQIETGLYERQADSVKITNFSDTLPSPQSELMEQAIKDPYIFDFISLRDDARERDLERALLDRIRNFLLELGTGFAFMGSQYHLVVAEQDYYIDLLFYHHGLRCLVAIDLKMGEFIPEHAGKMNFYLSALDDMVKHPDDQPAVGLILCKGKNGIIAEYSLRNLNRPMGVSEYRLTPKLPGNLKGGLPSPEVLAEFLEGEAAGREVLEDE